MNRRVSFYWLLATGYWLLFPACTLFDNTKLEQQKVQIERLRQESAQLRAEADALQHERETEEKERANCNKAFSSFDAARKATNDDDAIARYREGLDLCPSDEVAHNELGEVYTRAGRSDDARREFEAALTLNPNFARAQKNLDALR
ncbi:MAG: tetratricopeptide repeat protein [Deltaproteobacteria bacterium]|nr:tetratricopeptide repeat protein [Deltaproteobacteria bacterium]